MGSESRSLSTKQGAGLLAATMRTPGPTHRAALWYQWHCTTILPSVVRTILKSIIGYCVGYCVLVLGTFDAQCWAEQGIISHR